jgi:hypothetical protein
LGPIRSDLKVFPGCILELTSVTFRKFPPGIPLTILINLVQ